MAIKYRREGRTHSALGTHNRYEVRSRFRFRDARQRLLVIYIGIGIFSIFLLAFHFITQRVMTEWLPKQEGTGRVLEKRVEGEGTPDQLYWLVVEVSVPPADVEQATFAQKDAPDRDAASGALMLTGEVAVSEVDWRNVLPETVLRVEYRINAERTEVRIEGLSRNDG